MSDFFREYFRGIENDLRKAGMNIDEITYANIAKKNVIILSVGGTISFTVLSLILVILFKINPIIVLFIPIIGFVLSFVGSLTYYRIKPSLSISERTKKIERSLYIVAVYLASLASAGIHPKSLFYLLSKYEEFTEIRKEAQKIIQLTDGLGVSLNKAIEIVANNSPSKEWRDLLLGINHIIMGGGSLDTYLYEKARSYAEEFKRKLIEYSNTLQIFLEIYITLVIVGVVFIIILTSLMGSIAGGSSTSLQMFQLLAILVILPVGTIFLVILIKAISPFEE